MCNLGKRHYGEHLCAGNILNLGQWFCQYDEVQRFILFLTAVAILLVERSDLRIMREDALKNIYVKLF